MVRTPARRRLARSVALRPLRHRDFALIFGAGVVSNVGTWMETVAVGALLVSQTGRTAWVGLVAAAAFLPVGVLSPVGGALADRLERRRFIIAANAFEAGLASLLALLAATGTARPALVVGLAFLAGCSASLRMPFQQALLPDLVPPDDLLGAVSLGSAQYNLGRVAGPALAGIVVAQFGFAAAFAVNAVSFLAVIGAVAAVRVPLPPADDGAEGLWARIRMGARAAWAEPGCRSAICLIAVAALLVSPFIALVPAKAHDLVGDGARATASATAVLTTAQGIGAVAGALALAPLASRIGQRRTVVGAFLLTCASLVVYATAPTTWTAAAALVVVGAGYIGILSGLNTVVQLRAPAAFRARILSLYFVALGVVYPIGALLQGALADRVGLAQVTIAGAIALAAVVVTLGAARPGVLTALDARTP